MMKEGKSEESEGKKELDPPCHVQQTNAFRVCPAGSILHSQLLLAGLHLPSHPCPDSMSASISPAVLVGMHLAVMLSIASIWNKLVPEPYMVRRHSRFTSCVVTQSSLGENNYIVDNC